MSLMRSGAALRPRTLIPCVLAAAMLATAGCGSPSAGKPRHSTEIASAGSHKHGKAQHTRNGPVKHARTTALQRYARSLLPYLNQSAPVFDRAAAAAASQASACDSYGNQVSILESYADGVPHPAPWYKPVGTLHHTTFGVYHYMLGAIAACQTAAAGGDSGGTASAVTDMHVAAVQMHNLIAEVRQDSR